jgi:hypothetical protein
MPEDGLNGEEGMFTVCSFWLVSALTCWTRRRDR